MDVGFKYRGEVISPNFIGDAQNLPFRDSVFSEVRASHIIEEWPHWKQALYEWIRVCNNTVIIGFPYRDGFFRPLIRSILNLHYRPLKDAINCRKFKCHYWIINPNIVYLVSLKKWIQGQRSFKRISIVL